MFRPMLQQGLRFGRPVKLLSRSRLQFQQMLRFQSANAVKKPEPTGMKKLVKDYGYSALGVYLTLSMLDLPLCYLLVHLMGKEEIQKYENKAKQYFGYGKSDEQLAKEQEIDRIQEEHEPEPEGGMFPWFSWTEFAIAYGLHKSVLIFVRVPLTAALTPTIVKTLQRWGFRIGSAAATTPKFGTKVTKKNKWFSWFF